METFWLWVDSLTWFEWSMLVLTDFAAILAGLVILNYLIMGGKDD